MIPYVTFTLEQNKHFNDSTIIWHETINEEMLLNGNWYLHLKSITLSNISTPENGEDVEEDVEKSDVRKVMKINCNLTKNNYQWFGKIIQHQKSYQETYPIELFELNINKSKIENQDVHIDMLNSTMHKINCLNRTIEIIMSPLDPRYKLNDLQCKATVQVCLYKE